MAEPSTWKPEDYDWDPHKLVARARVTTSQASPSHSGGAKKGKLSFAAVET